MKILIIAAHPDDEILGMGGTIRKYVKNDHQVKIVIMATGIFARRSENYQNSTRYQTNQITSKSMEKELHDLRKDAEKASRLLGVADIEFLDFPDNEMDSVSLLKIVKTIEKEISIVKPDKIYTHHYNDLNIDHRVIFNATLTACRPVDSVVKEIIAFEVLSSTEWNYPAKFNPNYFVNIKTQLSAKIKAMQAYKNEIRDFPHPRSVENLRNVAERWGSVSGNTAAEAFEIIRKIEQ